MSESRTINSLISRYQSTGRALLYSFMGGDEVEASGEGSWITTRSGRRYLDWGSYAVMLLGHRHPKVVAAVVDQLQRLPISSRAFPAEVVAIASERLVLLAPAGLGKVMFLTSGAEAVEAAAKLARASTGRSNLVRVERGYHGKTLGALSLTDADLFRRPFESVLNDVSVISRSDIDMAAEHIASTKPAAVFIEPLQGEGGVFEFSSEFLGALRRACDAAGSLLVCDEIQCGLGRCGVTWMCVEKGVAPDILLTGKALGGGVVPVSALIARPEVFRPFDVDPLLHSSTFGANPLACAAVVATISVIDEEDIPSKSAWIGRIVSPLLNSFCSRHPQLFNGLSGRAAMWGLHCSEAHYAGYLIRNCLRRGLLLTPCLSTPTVVRLTPPAVASMDEIEFAFSVLSEAATETEIESQLH